MIVNSSDFSLKCRGARGLPCLPWVAAEVLKGYFSSQGVPPEKCGSKPQAWLFSLEHKNWERNTKKKKKNLAVKSSSVSIHQGEMAGDAETFLKGQHIKFHLQPLTLGSSRGRTEQTRTTWRESSVGGSGERAKGSATRIPVLSHPHTAESIFPDQNTPLHAASASASGEAIAPPTAIPFTLPYGA